MTKRETPKNYNMKIIPYENDNVYKDGFIAVDEVSVTYVVGGDCNEPADDTQVIMLVTRNNGTGRYIHIKTEGLSINGIEELEMIVKDFTERAGL